MKKQQIFSSHMKKLYNSLSQTQVIAIGFLIMIVTGTFLLMLPISSRDGEWTRFLDALFTATSASCVTGLIVFDTFQHWSRFGQIVLILLIQTGGLGFVTIGVFFSILLRRRIGLKSRGLLQESVNTLQIGGVVRLAKKIILGTLLIEGTGAILLSLRFIPMFGFAEGVFAGVFHSISAFCNAGFDLMSRGDASYISLTGQVGDWVINLVIMALIIMGGIGFIVWDDITRHKWHFRRYLLHTKLVLVMTALLIFVPSILFFLFEKDHLMAGMRPSEMFLASLFSSVTARTAGFNTIDTGLLQDCSKFLTIMLMFVGGSPGSTAGGIKTTTLAVLVITLFSNIRKKSGCNVFGRRLADDAVRRASIVFSINLFLTLIVTLAISALQPLPLTDILFETFSAIATVGMSTGLTRDLNDISRVLIILLMYCGRIGSLSFALAFTRTKQPAPVQQPVENISIG